MKNFKQKNSSNGITLIALVITIIVLLILAAVSIATLTGENGILTKANDAKDETGRTQVVEDARLAVLEIQTNNDGKISEDEFKGVLERYFKFSPETELPENLSDLVLTSKDEKYKDILASEIYNGNLKKEESNETSGYIQSSDGGNYGYKKEEGILKKYAIGEKVQSDKLNNFEKEIITMKKGSSGKERFYIMTLDAVGYTYNWYEKASRKFVGRDQGGVNQTENDFGQGKINTEKWIDNWNGTRFRRKRFK